MKKILIISDTHGAEDNIRKILKQESLVSEIFFLGDGVRDFNDILTENKDIFCYAVAGNCDLYALEPSEGFVSIENVLIYYTHGHKYDVKYTLDNLTKAAKIHGADIALFGHTHKAFKEARDGVLLFNPGSASNNYFDKATYGVIELDCGKIISAVQKQLGEK